MSQSLKSSTALFSVLMMLVAAGLILGCVNRESKGPQGQGLNLEPVAAKDLERFSSTIRRVDGSADAHYRLALYFQERYRHKLAIDELQKAIHADPGHVKAFNAMGVSYDNLGDHETAILYYRRALLIDPRLDYVHNNLGYSCLLKGDLPEAVEAFQAAIALDGAEKRYRNNLGLAYAKMDEYDLALVQFKVNATDEQAVTQLAKVMRDLGKPDAGKSWTAAAGKSGPAAPAPPAADREALAKDEVSEALAAGPAIDYNPAARYRSVMGSLRQPEEPSVAAATEVSPAPAAESPEAAPLETLTGPVIEVASAPEPRPAQPAILRAAVEPAGPPAAPEVKPAAGPVGERHTVASVRLSGPPAAEDQAASRQTPIEPPKVRAVAKEARMISPPHIEDARTPHTEAEEEHILVASASIRKGGWQSPPEPRQTLEKSLGIVEIEVENGNGAKGAAAKVAKHLRNNGFNVVRVADANSFDHLSTKVFYFSGNLKEVRRLLEILPEVAGEAELYEMQSAGTGVRLLIGKDLVEKNRELSWSRPEKRSAPAGG
jgi:hypothetical protein